MRNKPNYGGLDRFRLLAALLVVAIHTSPLTSINEGADFFLTRILARIAVPFFFMVTGQFVAAGLLKSPGKPGRYRKFLLKTALLYGFCIILYLPIGIYAGHYKDMTFLSALRMVVFDGTFYHLWYFPACILGMLLVRLMSRALSLRGMTIVSAILYVIGLFGDSYFGLVQKVPALNAAYEFSFQICSYTRNGLFFAPLFLVLGAWMAVLEKKKRRPASPLPLCIGLAISFGLMAAEGFLLRHFELQRHDSMYFALVPTMFFLYRCLMYPQVKSAKYFRNASMWIYVLHPAFIVVVRALAKPLKLTELLVENSLVHYLAVALLSVVAGLFMAYVQAKFHIALPEKASKEAARKAPASRKRPLPVLRNAEEQELRESDDDEVNFQRDYSLTDADSQGDYGFPDEDFQEDYGFPDEDSQGDYGIMGTDSRQDYGLESADSRQGYEFADSSSQQEDYLADINLQAEDGLTDLDLQDKDDYNLQADSGQETHDSPKMSVFSTLHPYHVFGDSENDDIFEENLVEDENPPLPRNNRYLSESTGRKRRPSGEISPREEREIQQKKQKEADHMSNQNNKEPSMTSDETAWGTVSLSSQTTPASRAWIELDRAALEQNVNFLRSRLPEHCRLMPAVKAQAYGHGAILISRQLNRLGVDAFCVACASEGIELREAGIQGEILILGYTSPEDFPLLCDYQLTQTVIDYPYAQELNRFGQTIHVHVGIDTGMHRVGIRCERIEEIAAVYQMQNLSVDGIFTHLCASDSPHPDHRSFTQSQIHAFYQVVEILEEQGYSCRGQHILASYGILNLLPDRTWHGGESVPPVGNRGSLDSDRLAADYVRPGIVLFGVLGTQTDLDVWKDFLRPVLSLKAKVASIRPLYAEESVGYGITYTAEKKMKIAAITIGYADGLPRELSNGRGSVLIHGHRAPIIGRICMDQTIVDISGIPNVQVGDTAVVIGSSGTLEITAGQIAEQCGTITHEILTGLADRLDRIWIGG